MQTPEDTHWIEAGLAALAAMGAWIWRVGRRYQQHEDRLHRLESDQAEILRQLGELSPQLAKIGQDLARHGVQIDHIAESTAEIRRVLFDGRVSGGRRWNDPQ